MSDRCIVQVWFEPESAQNGKPAQFSMIETECRDFTEFCLLVQENALIGGAVLWSRRGERHEQIITDRQPIAFRGGAVLRCQLPRWRFVEEQ